VISLDFELHWGVRDHQPTTGPYRHNLLGAREAIPRMLDAFARHGVAATWAIVGFLFAESRDELLAYAPAERPTYDEAKYDPYREPLGRDEVDDPLHFAPSLVRRVAETPRQEVASHTYSHYFCLEQGQTLEQFRADLTAAKRIAAAKGYDVQSLVLPRNQINPAYFRAVREAGFRCVRGHERSWLYRPCARGRERLARRAGRLADAYLDLSGPHETPWTRLRAEGGLVDVPSSRFLRPYSARFARLEPVRLARVEAAMGAAARRGAIFHLWWHPHNFGSRPRENLAGLERVLRHYVRLRDEFGMRSLTMGEVASAVDA
jgi:peptidoglycan/xylan/chitin deacetylase (PgdA/CDA1 family)